MREALAIIEDVGVEQLSLRDVARRLGVSHQAPYKHFQSRDHILAEIVGRSFASFAQHLDASSQMDASSQGGRPPDDLGAMGRAYLDYALRHPLHYRLMFGTPLPDTGEHPDMMRHAQHAFALLRDCLSRAQARSGSRPDQRDVELDAMFVWSTMHGLASILQTSALTGLGLSPDVLAATASHTLQRIGAALGAELPGADDCPVPEEPA